MEWNRGRAAGSMSTRWRRRVTAGGLTLGFSAVVAFLMVAPAAAVAPNFTLHPPYTHAKVALTNPATKSGCGTDTLVSGAAFNKTSGAARFSDAANTTWCTKSTNNSAVQEGSVTLSFAVHVKTTGAHTISVVWVTIATGFVNLTAGTCSGNSGSLYSGCTRSAQTFVYGSAVLIDKNTLKKTGPSNKWPGNFTYISNYTSCYYTTCTSTHMGGSSGSLHTGSAFWVWDWNGTAMNATHNYTLKMTIFGGVKTMLMTSGGAALAGASANAQLNSATLGNEEDLYSITVT